MGNVVVKVELPEAVVEFYGGPEPLRQALSEGAVLELVRRGEIDPSRGSHLLGMPLGDFARLMAAHGIDYYSFTPEEWAEEVSRVEEMLQDLPREATRAA